MSLFLFLVVVVVEHVDGQTSKSCVALRTLNLVGCVVFFANLWKPALKAKALITAPDRPDSTLSYSTG